MAIESQNSTMGNSTTSTTDTATAGPVVYTRTIQPTTVAPVTRTHFLLLVVAVVPGKPGFHFSLPYCLVYC